MIQLHCRISKPSSATDVAMMTLCLPSLNDFNTSSCFTCVCPAVNGHIIVIRKASSNTSGLWVSENADLASKWHCLTMTDAMQTDTFSWYIVKIQETNTKISTLILHAKQSQEMQKLINGVVNLHSLSSYILNLTWHEFVLPICILFLVFTVPHVRSS